MVSKVVSKLVVAIASTVLSLTVTETNPASAAIITYDFQGDITSGEFAGQEYSGFFSYDDASPSGASDLLLPYFEATEFNLNFGGQTYTSYAVLCRSNFPECLPLLISGGEAVLTPSGAPLYLIPRGGELVRFAFSNYNPFDPFEGFFSLVGSPGSSDLTYQLPFLPGQPPASIGGGRGTSSLRTTAVPEPSAILGLGALSLSLLLRKKKVLAQQ